MSICEIKAKKSFAGPGIWAWLAETRVEDENANERYVTVHYYDGEVYTVSEQSVYDHFDDDDGDPVNEFIEEYDNYRDARKSAYAKEFETLRKLIDKM